MKQRILICPLTAKFTDIEVIGKKNANALTLAKNTMDGKFLWVKEWQFIKNAFTGSF